MRPTPNYLKTLWRASHQTTTCRSLIAFPFLIALIATFVFGGPTGKTNAEENAADGQDAVLATETWDGLGTNNSWTTNDNWTGIGGAGANDVLQFLQSAARKSNDNDFPVNTSFDGLIFSGTNYNITGNQIFLANGISCNIPNNGENLPNFHPNIILGADQSFHSGSIGFRPCILSGVINLNGHTLTLFGFGNHRLDGFINGTGTLLMTGGGTVFLSGNSPNFGTTRIELGASGPGGIEVNGTLGGNIQLSSGKISGTGTVGAIDAGLATGPNDGIISPGVSGSGSTGVLTATGFVEFSSTSSFEVNVTGTQSDRLNVTGGSSVALNGADLNLLVGTAPVPGQQFTIIQITGAGAITGQFAQGATITVSGRVFGITYSSQSVVLTALSSLTWDGGGPNNNWSTAANWSPDFAPVDGLNLVFPAGVPADSLTNSNDIVGLGVGSIMVSGGGYNITGLAITLSNGITANAPSGGAIIFNPNITLTQAQSFINNGLANLKIFSTINLNGVVITVGGTNISEFHGQVTGAGGIAKTGTGTLFLANSINNYTGVTQINNGSVGAAAPNALGATGVGNNTVVASGATLNLQNNISLAEPVTLNGTGVDGTGALQGITCSTGCSISGAITLTTTSTVSVSFSDTLTLSGVIDQASGGLGLTKIGAGTLILGGSNGYGGTTTINAGTLLVNGSIINSVVNLTAGTLGGTGTVDRITATGGTIAPGLSPGSLDVNGAVTLNAASTFNVEIGGTTAGTQYDRLNLTGSGIVTLNGATLTGSLINGFNPTPGQVFTIISGGVSSFTGQFAQGNSVTIGGQPFSITYTANNLVGNIAFLTALPVISGTVTYGNAAAPPKFISNVTVTGTGSPIVTTFTGAPGATAGQYELTGFGAGSYTVSLSKTTGQNSITSNDAARIAQHVAGSVPFTNDSQRVTADVTGNGGISSQDAAKIAQFVAGLPFSPPNLTSTWQFFVSPGPTFPVAGSPTTRTYPSVTSNITGDDYTGLLIGEVTGNWMPTAARPVNRSNDREKGMTVELPILRIPADEEVRIPINVQGAANKEIISYEFNLRYDPSVIQPQDAPVNLSGTVSRGLSAVSNATEPGLLRVVVYGPAPIDDDGLLLNLRFTAVGDAGSISPLTLEKIMFNEGDPWVATTDGQVELSASAPNHAEINGQLLTTMGRGVPNTRVTLTDTAGTSRSVVSNAFGVYRFGGVQIGQTYTVSVESRRYTFTPLTVSVTGQSLRLDMIAEQ